MGRCLLNRTFRSCSKNCAKQKRYVFVMRCLSGALPTGGAPKKLLNDKIFIFWREGVIRQPPKGVCRKIAEHKNGTFLWEGVVYAETLQVSA